MMSENYPQTANPSLQIGYGEVKMSNPTLRENIERKIQYHKDEIIRLGKIKESMSIMLDVNLRDLREAMSF